jgi:hypothetical protein
MVYHRYSGLRCRTVRHLTTRDGILPRDTFGTVRYEMENLDRHLVAVDWDNGMDTLVFPQEIEIGVSHELSTLAGV